MLNYFLNQDKGLTEKKRKLIQKKFLARRKYNPFHLDCEYTKRKLCYCKKNPISYLSQAQKAVLWTNSYMKPYEFYQSRRQEITPNAGINSKMANGQNNNRMEQQSARLGTTATRQHREQQQSLKQISPDQDAKLEQETKREFNNCINKIRALSKEELISFIQEYSRKYRSVGADSNDNHMMNMY